MNSSPMGMRGMGSKALVRRRDHSLPRCRFTHCGTQTVARTHPRRRTDKQDILTSYVKANFGAARHSRTRVSWMDGDASYRMPVSRAFGKNVAYTLRRPRPRILNLRRVNLRPDRPQFRFAEIPAGQCAPLEFAFSMVERGLVLEMLRALGND